MSNKKSTFPSLSAVTDDDLGRTPQIDSDSVAQAMVRDIPVPGERDNYTLAYYELLTQFDRDVPFHGTESTRPENPQDGFTFFNTDTRKYEKYTGGEWEVIGGVGTPESPLDEIYVDNLSAGNIDTDPTDGGGGGGGFDDSVIDEIEQTANDAQASAQQARQRVGNLAESIENVDTRVSSFEGQLESVQQTAQSAQQQAQLSRDRASDAFEEVSRVESEAVKKAGDTMGGDLDFDGQYDVIGVDTLDVNTIEGSVSMGTSSVDMLTVQDAGNGNITTDSLDVKDANDNPGPLTAGETTLGDVTANAATVESLVSNTSVTAESGELNTLVVQNGGNGSITTDSVTVEDADGNAGPLEAGETTLEDVTANAVTADAVTVTNGVEATSVTSDSMSAVTGTLNTLTVRDGGSGSIAADSVTVEDANGNAGPLEAGETTLDNVTADAVTVTNSVDAATGTFSNSLTVNGIDVESAIGNVETNLSDTESNLQSQIDTNESNITTNADDISALQTNLSDTESNLQSQIDTNSNSISANASDISTNASDISTNASNISSNDSDISALQSDVSTNASDISAVETDVSNLQTSVSNNDSDINTLQSDVSSLQTNKADRTGDDITATTLEVTDSLILPSTL